MKLPSTYLIQHRKYTNEYLLKKATDAIQLENGKPIILMSDFHRKARIKKLAQIICEGEQDPAAKATMNLHTWEPHDTGKKRVGQPRINWLKETLQDAWIEANRNIRNADEKINVKKEEHRTTTRIYLHTINEERNAKSSNKGTATIEEYIEEHIYTQ
jgi:hypothetical protein